MPDETPEAPILNDWRQGDFTLSDVELPVWGLDTDGVYFGGKTVPGVAIISQTCDIVRHHGERPMVQVAALARASTEEISAIQARKKPRYGYLAGLETVGLVVDFDVVASAEKQLVASWTRQVGCESDQEERDFAAALARHKQRFAFPDDFNRALKPLRRWIERRFEKPSTAGQLLRSIDQIRVRCEDWSNPGMGIEFICLLIGDPPVTDRATWGAALTEMSKTVTDIYPEAFMRLSTWDEFSAAEYVSSDRLDLDGLSDS